MDTTSDGTRPTRADVSLPQVRVFINYRRDDTRGEAQLLYDRLAGRFGSTNLFLDVRSLLPGMKWLEEIKAHADACHVFLALIGPHWASIMRAREQAAVIHPDEDYVRSEIQRALRANSGIHVIPVLIGGKAALSDEELPRSLRALAGLEVARIREKDFEHDIGLLIGRLEVIAGEHSGTSSEVTAAGGEERRLAPIPAGTSGVAPPPDAAHYEDVLQQVVDEGNLVPFLGSRLTAATAEGPPSLPDTGQLAAKLAEQFGMRQAPPDLPGIAQYVYVTKGRPDLYRALRKLLTADYEPGPVHRFLARLPGMLDDLGLERRYQLIVTTNFDTALERAFDEEREPYDLAVYMASGPDAGKFVHIPHEGAPRPIDDPNSYTKLPIRLDYELERTVIVKIHGAVDGSVGGYRWRENYVITEDHYIDYLSRSPVENLVPVQVLDKLKESHCLFLGYMVRDWNSRVFLKRIWEGSLGAKSWAVEPDPGILEKSLWAQCNVDLYAADLRDYIGMLRDRLSRRAPKRPA